MPQPLDYLECYECNIKNGWKKIDEKHAIAIDKLAQCVANGGKLRECSQEIAKILNVSYRRLEETAKCVGVIRKIKRGKWETYGKLVEVRIYIKYKSKKKKSWNRHIEIGFVIATYLEKDCIELLELGFDYWYNVAIEKIENKDVELLEYIVSLMVEGTETGKSGCRELTQENYEELNLPVWCNNVFKDWYKGEYTIKRIIVYDYRSGERSKPKYSWVVYDCYEEDDCNEDV